MDLEKNAPRPEPDYPTLAEHREPRCRWRKLASLAAALAALGAVAYAGDTICKPLIMKIFHLQETQDIQFDGKISEPMPPPPTGDNANGP